VLSDGEVVHLGSESLEAVDDWLDIHSAFGESVVLSLDVGADGERGPEPLFSDPGLWPNRLVAIDLSRVGTGEGPDIDRLSAILDMADGRAVFSGGGVRNAADLAAIKALDAQGALIATALHTSAITQNEIAALG
jgi:phosphoribosylformimino-5-aminoimidazole carboxamide ribotide isomerase